MDGICYSANHVRGSRREMRRVPSEVTLALLFVMTFSGAAKMFAGQDRNDRLPASASSLKSVLQDLHPAMPMMWRNSIRTWVKPFMALRGLLASRANARTSCSRRDGQLRYGEDLTGTQVSQVLGYFMPELLPLWGL